MPEGNPQSAAAGPAVLEVRDLAKHFDVSKPWLARVLENQPKQILKAVDGLSFEINKGETFSLVGESGCGKSTVAKLIVGLHRPSRGEIIFDGINLSNVTDKKEANAVRRRWQMIFQDPYASLNPRWRVRDIVSEPIRVFKLARSSEEIRDRVGELLTQVGLSPADGDKFPHEFSGGQRQRISIARALSSEPEFLVCDEPTSALDVSVQAQILNLMKDLQRRLGLTYLFISHNLAVVYHVSDKIGVMYLGRLCEIATASDLFKNPKHPYTRLLLNTIPDMDMTGKARLPVQGEVPNPIDPPNGCSFHPRCPFANERCRQESPQLQKSGDTIVACHAVEENRSS
jgi:peptide/nickel transport system ATP-binding protein